LEQIHDAREMPVSLPKATAVPLLGLLWLVGGVAVHSAPEPQQAAALYAEHCASCHGDRRYGGYSPPLLPQTLARKSDRVLERAILDGLPNTQMEPFAKLLDGEQARALVRLLREPVEGISWSAADMSASRVEFDIEAGAIPATLQRESLTLVVERGKGSVSVLDGDGLTELDRFEVGRIHGGIKFDRALRRALASTRDGTLAAYDLQRGGLWAKVKVGVNTRNVAISADGAFVAAANQLPQALVILDGDLHPLRVFPLEGQPSAVYQVPGSDRFLLTLRDAPRLYWIRYPELTLQSVELPEPFEDFVFVPGTQRLVASSRGGSRLLLYDYAREQVVATLATQGLPHLFSACFFPGPAGLRAAFNHLGTPRLTIVDMQSFEVVKEVPLRGSGYFARTHPGTPYLWVDTHTEEIQLIAKDSLELSVRSVVPERGKKAMHVEFTSDGARAFVSVWDDDGAVVVYDSTSLEELGRRSYAMPVGKYNAGNKTRLLQ
jgi:mono/diheme cytochrome c family protein